MVLTAAQLRTISELVKDELDSSLITVDPVVKGGTNIGEILVTAPGQKMFKITKTGRQI